ncbi:MAG: hypothetical protein ABIQ40_00355 [Bacteroidia bacterium]
MKTKALFFFAVILMTITIFSGCKKYDEGPAMSIHSKKARIENLWRFEKVNDQSGGDMTADYINITAEFKKNGDFIITDGTDTEAGMWELSSDKEDIILTNSDDGYIWKWHITKLKNKEMWAKVFDGTDYTEFHLLPK